MLELFIEYTSTCFEQKRFVNNSISRPKTSQVINQNCLKLFVVANSSGKFNCVKKNKSKIVKLNFWKNVVCDTQKCEQFENSLVVSK